MTSRLLPVSDSGKATLDLRQFPAHREGNVSLDVQANDSHRDQLPVSGLGERGQPDANHAVILGEFGDEVCVRVRRPFIEDHNGVFDSSALSYDRHAASYVAGRVDWRARRAAIVEFIRRAEGGR